MIEGTRFQKTSINTGKTERIISIIGGSLLVLFMVMRMAKITGTVTRRNKPGLIKKVLNRTPIVGPRLARRKPTSETIREIVVRTSPVNIPIALAGGYLLFQGITGKSPVYRALGITHNDIDGRSGIDVTRSVTILKPRHDVYEFWRRLENLPSFMQHLESVQVMNGNRSHWVAKGPVKTLVEWDAEIIEDKSDELISWRSIPGAVVENRGTVRFKDAPGEKGTVVTVHMMYSPPGGSFSAAFAKLFGEEPGSQVRDDLRRLKQYLETGVIATVEGQSSGRRKEVEQERNKLVAITGEKRKEMTGS